MTGHALIADYQAALSQILFENTDGSGIDSDRTITLTVNDGQTNSVAISRIMHVYGPAFSTGKSDSAYLTQGDALIAVNLVTGTATTLKDDLFSSGAINPNATAFSPIDGHIYTYKSGTVYRINSDYTYNTFAVSGLSGGLISGDMDTSGNYYGSSGTGPIYVVDLNPSHTTTYKTILRSMTITGMPSSASVNDIALNPIDNTIYAVTSGTNSDQLVSINPTTGALTTLKTSITGETGTYGADYFGDDGYLYVSNNTTGHIYRIHLNGSSSTSVLFVNGPSSSSNDGARIVTINVDYGDAPDPYKTTIASDGARHSIISATNPYLQLFRN